MYFLEFWTHDRKSNAIFRMQLIQSASGVQTDPRCKQIENRQLYIGLFTAVFGSAIVAIVKKLHTKKTIKHKIPQDEKDKLVRKWVLKENIANVFGVLYCLFAASYLFAFSCTVHMPDFRFAYT